MFGGVVSSSTKQGLCQICMEKSSKYKCPRCQVRTCSLICVQSHKVKNQCSGVRNRLEMIPKGNMDNFTLLSDYRLLEEIDLKIEDGRRNSLRKSIEKGRETLQDLPNHLRRLKYEAKRRGTVLEYMPKHFSMHQLNTSRYLFSDGKIKWHIKLVFPQADLHFTEEKVDEDTLIVDLLNKYMEPYWCLDDDQKGTISLEDCEKLCYYHSASYQGIAVLFQSSLCYHDKKYIEMFPSKSLRINLANRKIVEYPVFYVILKSHIDAYIEEIEENEMESLPSTTERETNVEENIKKHFDKKLTIGDQRVPNIERRINYFDYFSDMSDDD